VSQVREAAGGSGGGGGCGNGEEYDVTQVVW